MAFIIDKIREKIGSEGKDNGEKGFDDMNYIIGNSSAMDIGEFPTPMDERIGYASMVGGKLMELQITNPATFELEGDKMIKTIDQLGLDVTLHPDMNAGFCTAEKSARGEEYGYDTVEQYFTNYMQELAYFKKRVYGGEDEEPLFNIGRMNPHISTSPMPALNERMANDVGVDPFGFPMDVYDEASRERRKSKSKDIWSNKEFLKKFYDLYLKAIVDQKWQLFTGRQGLFTQYSDKFDRVYRDTMRKACDHFYRIRTESDDVNTLQEMISLVSTAARADVGVQNAWLNEIDSPLKMNSEIVEIELLEIPEEVRENTPDDQLASIEEKKNEYTIEKLSDLNDFLDPNVRVTRINSLAEALYNIRNREFSLPRGDRELTMLVNNDDLRIKKGNYAEAEKIANKNIKKGLNDIWNGETEEEEDEFLITVQGKLRALANNADIEVDRIRNRALKERGEGPNGKEYDIDEAARKALANEEGFFEEERRYHQFMEALIGQFGREMWKESSLFYYIIPGWMSSSSEGNEDHKEWEAPEFIWKTIVKDKWEDLDNVNIDLENPSNANSEDFHYLELLEENREFRMDVVAAVGACYAWAHFTQRRAKFDLKGRDYGLTDEQVREVQKEGWTWVRWMNEFGLGVNLETMQGSPQMRFKVWRPKDIAVTAHAINLTAREQLDEISDELDGCPAKFTIDMEHVATLGAPPMHEMELFWKQEEELASTDYQLGIDPYKPIAKILRQMHLMDPGVESRRGGTYHGSFERGNEQLYNQLYTFVKHGFARNEDEPATILFELAEHNDESGYMMRITMDLIQLGVKPEDLDPARVDPSKKPESEEEALIGRFYGIERENYTREWAKIEEHAFDPLKGLLEAEEFDYTYSSKAAIDNGKRPGEFQGEEYK